MKKNKKDRSDMEMMNHLIELRKRSIFSLIYFVIILTISFYYAPVLMIIIKESVTREVVELNVFNVTDALYIYMRIATLSALIVTTPFAFWQLWCFIKPGLKKKEIQFVRRHMPLILVLFLAGSAFAYFVIVPYYVTFSMTLAQSNDLESMIGAKEYIDFIVKTVWPFGVAFEMPIIIYILSAIGLVNSQLLTAIRGYAYIGLMVISAFLTPPDPVSMGIMLIPLSILFESSVLIAKHNENRRKK